MSGCDAHGGTVRASGADLPVVALVGQRVQQRRDDGAIERLAELGGCESATSRA